MGYGVSVLVREGLGNVATILGVVADLLVTERADVCEVEARG